uniref:receptor protein-tyrosine kinase n=1 Tax=Sagmariasus verreauxi TaxID=1412110 RepID=A0A161HYN2_9EUCA|nr:tyrosine kinase insulin receptor [Sagmariasus verreauxi]
MVFHITPIVVVSVTGVYVTCRLVVARVSYLQVNTFLDLYPFSCLQESQGLTAWCGSSKHSKHHLLNEHKQFMYNVENDRYMKIFQIVSAKLYDQSKLKMKECETRTKASIRILQKSQRKSVRTPMILNPKERVELLSHSDKRLELRSEEVSESLDGTRKTVSPSLSQCIRREDTTASPVPTPGTRPFRGTSWGVGRWWKVVVVLALWVWAGECRAQASTHHTPNICQQRYNGTADKICGSMDLRNSISALEKLCPCRIIDGHLHFVLQEQRDSASMTRLSQYSFPGLREITHHLLIYRVFSLASLHSLFPNLAVIRGDVLFHNYALVIYDVPSLQEVGLVSLTVILRGSVRIERNPQLCYVHTVDWGHITVNRLAENYINRNRPVSECPSCPEELGCRRSKGCGAPRCWGSHACQSRCGSECPGGCVGDQCCHEECLGGCLTPGDPNTCHACRSLLDDGRCTHACSSPKFKVLKHRCETREVCSSQYAIKRDTQECVERCPLGYNETVTRMGSRNVTECVPCEGYVCTKQCSARTVKSISHAQLLRGCTEIDGHLTVHINGGENIEQELVENLSGIEVVRSYVKIFRSNITSLNFLSNLTTIGGSQLLYSNYSLVILDNPNLQTLWNTTNLTIKKGKVFVQSNPKLCLHHVQELINNTNITGLSDTDVSSTSNGDKVPCKVTPLKASVSTSVLYGTLTVTVFPHLPSVTVYYVNYKKADRNISLYESEGPCSDQGWSTVEMAAGNATGAGGAVHGTIVNLEPYTRYAVYVKTYSLASSEEGAQSDVLYAVTSPYNPTEPVHLEWASPNSRTLELWWEAPRRPNGQIDHYLVKLTLLPDTPRIPPDFDFCSPETRKYVDKKMAAMAQAEATIAPVRKTPTVEQKDPAEDPGGDDLCQATPATPSCCACRHPRLDEDHEVMGQISFEDFIMDNVYVKKINRSGRRTRESRLISDEEFENKLQAAHHPHTRNTLLKTVQSNASTSFGEADGEDDLSVSSFEDEDFPVHWGQTVHEFPTHAGIEADYRLHEENLTEYDRPHPNLSSVLLEQVHMTREPRLTLDNLHHFSLYSVGVVACQAPLGVSVSDQWGQPSPQGKLCSTIPARTAAYTRASDAADLIPEGSLRTMVLNNTSKESVVITWDPPGSPNGGVVAYILKIQSFSRDRCINSREFEYQGRRVEVRDLSPGNYSVWVKVRSKAKYGNVSAPAYFIIKDASRTDVSLVVASSLLAVAGAVLAAFTYWLWRRFRLTYSIPDTLDKVDINPYYREGFAPAEIFREEFIFWRDDLKVFYDRPLGQGFFGMVFEGQLNKDSRRTRVAVKTHSERATNEEIGQFLKEAAVVQNISCHHVVRLLGVVGDYAPVYVVMELMQEGDLKTFLNKHPPNFITGQKMMEMAVEAADGMAYLAAGKLVHRDLAARNCMLDHQLTLKIGDFGLTRNLKSDYYRTGGQGAMPVKWMAPESLQFNLYSTQSDVWSYGVLLWEMATRGVTPYKNRTNDEVIRLVVERYATPGRPKNCPLPIQRLMRCCWRYEARERPTFLAITKYLLKYTSLDYQKRFEQVSFYHSRSSDYSKYQRKETCGFMSECARESEEDLDQLALLTSCEASEEDISERDSGRYRSTPHGSPRLGRGSSPRLRKMSPRPSTTSFGRTLDGGDGLQCDHSQHSSPGDLRQEEKIKRHLYSNFDSEELHFGQRLQAGGASQMAPPGGLPTLLIPQDYRELRYAQLQLSTPSTPASGSHTPSSCPLTPSSNPQTPFLHPHSGLWPSPTCPSLQRSVSPLALNSPGSSPTLLNSSQTSVKSRASSPKLMRALYSNLQCLSSLQVASSTLALSPTPLNVGSRPPLNTPTQRSATEEPSRRFTGERCLAATTASTPAIPHGSEQPHRHMSKSTIHSPSTRDPPIPAPGPGVNPRHPQWPCNPPPSSSATPTTSSPLEAEHAHVHSSSCPAVSQDSSRQDLGSCSGSLHRWIQKVSPPASLPRSRSGPLRKKAASEGQMQKDSSPPGAFEIL